MAGRRPKPTQLKKLAGNPGKRALNEREPVAAVKLPPVPKFLSPTAKAEYRRVGRLLVQMGLVTEVDRAALAGYAQAYARWAEAEAVLNSPTHFMVNVENKASAWWLISRDAQKLMRAYMTEFGMTPATRGKVEAAGDDNEKSLAALLFEDVLSG